MMYDVIDETKIDVEIEKSRAKARYAIMNNKNEGNDKRRNENDDNNNNHEIGGEVFSFKDKVADYANLRVTDLPSVQRLYPPKPASLSKEVSMQSLKGKLLRKVREYQEKRCKR